MSDNAQGEMINSSDDPLAGMFDGFLGIEATPEEQKLFDDLRRIPVVIATGLRIIDGDRRYTSEGRDEAVAALSGKLGPAWDEHGHAVERLRQEAAREWHGMLETAMAITPEKQHWAGVIGASLLSKSAEQIESILHEAQRTADFDTLRVVLAIPDAVLDRPLTPEYRTGAATFLVERHGFGSDLVARNARRMAAVEQLQMLHQVTGMYVGDLRGRAGDIAGAIAA